MNPRKENKMARIRHSKYAGKKHAIGSLIIEFDEAGEAEVPTEVAQGIEGIPGYEVLDMNGSSDSAPAEVVVPVT